MKLIWGHGSGLVDNDINPKWSISNAPVFSFPYDGVFYNSDNGSAVRNLNGGRDHLTAEEQLEIVSYVSSLSPVAPIVATLQQIQDQAWEDIKAERTRRSSTGGYLVSGKWFHSDADSRIQQLGLFLMGASVPAVQWKTMDGSFVTMTQTLAAGIFSACALSDQAIFSRAEAHKTSMLASSSPETYNYLTGWPLIFGE